MSNVACLLAITPERHFIGWWRYFDDFLMRGSSGLSKTQREMIAVVVSPKPLPYCLRAHAAA